MTASEYDVVRIVALVLGSATIAVAGVVAVTYARLYVRHRRSSLPAWRGLLPAHVVLITSSYIGLIVGTMIETFLRLREDPTARSSFYVVLYLAGIAAMWVILGHQAHRARNINAAEHANDVAEQ